MENASQTFSKSIDKAYGELPKINSEIMKDISKYKTITRESDEGLSKDMSLEDVAKKHSKKEGDINTILPKLKRQIKIGVDVEMEHTKNKSEAKKIAMDHLVEDPEYYSKLKKIENKEATGTGSAGQYSQPLFSGEEPKKMETNEANESKIRSKIEKILKEKLGRKPTKEEVDNIHIKIIEKLYKEIKNKKTEKKKVSSEETNKIEATEATTSASSGSYESPAAWAKSTKKKDWRGASKTQIPGGSFVSVKKKCKSFPYCNQGDINALDFFKNESVKDAISKVANKLNISENVIKAILDYEYEKQINLNIYNKK